MKCNFLSKVALSASIVLGAGFGTPVLAENTNTGSTQINYTVAESYAWTSPADFNFTSNTNGSEAKNTTVNITKNTIGANKVLKVNIASDQVFELTDTTNSSNKRTYTVKDGSNVLSAGSEVLSVEAGNNTASKTLAIQMASVGTEVAGTYKGTLRFVSTIESTGTGSGGSGGGSSSGGSGGASLIDGTNVTLNDVDGNGTVSKGDKITFAASYLYADAGSSSPTEFLVLNSDGSTAELMATTNYQNSAFNSSSVTTTDSAGNTVQQYEGSTLDTLLNSTYYNSLSSTVKGKIQAKAITQNSWNSGSGSDLTITDFNSKNISYGKIDTVATYDRNVYALDIQDIVDYLGTSITGAQMNKMFFGAEESVDQYVWLRSANSTNDDFAFFVHGGYGYARSSRYSAPLEARPAFTISLN